MWGDWKRDRTRQIQVYIEHTRKPLIEWTTDDFYHFVKDMGWSHIRIHSVTEVMKPLFKKITKNSRCNHDGQRKVAERIRELRLRMGRRDGNRNNNYFSYIIRSVCRLYKAIG